MYLQHLYESQGPKIWIYITDYKSINVPTIKAYVGFKNFPTEASNIAVVDYVSGNDVDFIFER